MVDLIERLRDRASKMHDHSRQPVKAELTEAADELSALRESVAKAAEILVQARDGQEAYHRARIISALNVLTPESDNG